MIIRKIPHISFSGMQLQQLRSAGFLRQAFCLEFPLPELSAAAEMALLDIPGALQLRLINRSYADETDDIGSLRREGCFYFNEEKEWILEAQCRMSTSDGCYADTYALRLPLSAPWARGGRIGMYFDGVYLRFVKDGAILNENTGLDRFCEPTGPLQLAPQWQGECLAASLPKAEISYMEIVDPANADLYSPTDWNCFAGDIMNFYHDGVYHLLYLRDRRHHGSRNGKGAHDIRQLTTRDLIHWTEQEPVTEIDSAWMGYGTGTMLYHNGKYYMTYGYHTERYPGSQQQVVCTYDEQRRAFRPLSCEDILRAGQLPAGASFAVSDDGIHFTPSGRLFHPGRNPSAYAMPDGKVRVYAGYMGEGVFEADSFDEPFTAVDEPMDFVGRSVMRCSTECPCFFEWNGYRYLIIGFTGYFRSLEAGGEYADMAGREEIYDGLCVPMVAPFGKNRRLIAGWLNGVGWGSVIVHRELLQEPDGCLGMKWVPELLPETEPGAILLTDAQEKLPIPPKTGLLIEMTLEAGEARRIAVQFCDGDSAAELQLDPARKRIQFAGSDAGCMAEPLRTSSEIARQMGDSFDWHRADLPIARNSKDFCIGNVQGMQGRFRLRILLRYSRKLRATVIDAEIAARRTIISVRPGFFPDSMRILCEDGVKASDISIKRTK